MKSLGKKMKLLRVEKDMSTMDLAKLTGLSQGYISNIENNAEMNPTISTIVKLAKALNVDPGDLVSDEIAVPKSVLDKLPSDVQEWLAKPDALPYILIAIDLYNDNAPPQKALKIVRAFYEITNE